MSLSLIPWELIWLLAVMVLLLSSVGWVTSQIRNRSPQWPRSGWWYLSLAVVLVMPVLMNVTNTFFDLSPSNDARTEFEHPIPTLEPQRYKNIESQTLYDAALRSVQQQRTYGQKWTIRFAEFLPALNEGRIIAQVPVLFWLDEISITIHQVDPSLMQLQTVWQINVYSTATDRSIDFGENTRHIYQFYQTLNQEMSQP